MGALRSCRPSAPVCKTVTDPYRTPAEGRSSPEGSSSVELTAEERQRMFGTNPPVCPDCGAQLLKGPEGGLSVNVACSDEACGSRFNYMGPFGVERISDARPRKVGP